MKLLDKFLYALLANPIIKTSHLFYEFLTLEETAFNNRKKELSKTLKPPAKLSEHKNLDGFVKKFI